MSVRFGSDGTLYCNSIQRNWGVARNMIRYGCGCGKSFDGYSPWANNSGLTGYKTGGINTTGCCFHWEFTGTPGQDLPAIKKGCLYYFSTWYAVGSGSGGASFVIRNGGADKYYIPLTIDGKWHFGSIVFKATETINAGSWGNISSNANFVCWVNSQNMDFTRTILFCINEAFGDTIANSFSTNFWKSWCDTYLRENRTLVAAGYTGVTDYGKPDGTGGGTSSTADYNKTSSEDDSYYDREWYIAYNTGTSSEALLYFRKNELPMYKGNYYYIGTYFSNLHRTAAIGKTHDWYWPEAEPAAGSGIPILATQSKYGNCNSWKLVSCYNIRNNWSSGTYRARFDVNNGRTNVRVYMHSFAHFLQIGTAGSSSGWFYDFNTLKGTSLTTTSAGVNRYFFDCWADGYSQPFIHCPSPLAEDKKIQFNTSYDVICNDIIIEPWQSKIYFDEIGRIHCKTISPTVQSFV